ncbi:MAG: cysteine--tRNA ligase [Firmicutes bacterium HGW-Firmicutes-9]|jgi:cysteinyl-tRNA synthetase|nr:MAG: cysteine--tRNA ligase [Firmicutes bacterium HGW-Firmicutes-9]
MQIYNTMTRKKEELVPLIPGQISMYACGPTVYNYFHIGNARPFIVFDTLRRYLEYRGYNVRFVQNFTDIDDKMIRRANEEGTTVKELGERFIKEYYHDADALGVRRASNNPRATEHIGEIIALVNGLIEKGHAYATPEGDVYFSVRSFPGYGKLSGQNIDDLENGARVDPDEAKRDPLDFALWKAEKPGEPSWDSPWGKGRPGWHIECSAMSMAILGETFDIHGGGQDLIFPHHENEIAQSEAATGKPFARYWMHNGYINVDNQKMSKSLNNFFTVRDIAQEFDLEAVRMFMLAVQYRNPVNFSRDMILQAQTALERLRTAKERLAEATLTSVETAEDAAFLAQLDDFKTRFNEAMDDDLNTADAIGVLFDFARAANTFVTEPRGKAAVEAGKALFSELTGVLGLLTHEKAEEFPQEALALLEERQAVRKAKNFARADEIRDTLKNMGFTVEDTANGPKLKKI